ncbi:MAG: hypothetical protein M3220_17925 [Chloroflexota bacterium]|nr:hypothetical protein [Chloroflexota bacterium]
MGNVSSTRDLLLSLGFGIAALLFFHLDHLVVTYSGWNNTDWLLHLLVDSGYVLLYASLGWLVLRGWRVWRQNMKDEE